MCQGRKTLLLSLISNTNLTHPTVELSRCKIHMHNFDHSFTYCQPLQGILDDLQLAAKHELMLREKVVDIIYGKIMTFLLD